MNILYKLAVTAAVAAISLPAIAAPSVYEYCEGVQAIAAASMELRQSGADYAEAEQSARIVQALDIWPDLVIPIMADAYRVPAYYSAAYRETAVIEFGEKYRQACVVTLITGK